MLISIVFLASLFAFMAYVVAGRLAGLSVTALCSATMAFFLMPPVFSLRVSHWNDIIVLAFYGIAGLVLARTTPPRKRVLAPVEASCVVGARKRVESTLSRALEDVMATDLGDRLQAFGLAPAMQGITLPCTPGDAHRILSDVLTAALQTAALQHLAIDVAQRPGLRRIIVTAHRVWPPPLCKVIIVGKRDEDCETVQFPGWSLRWHASWFDNGYDSIYQISIKEDA